MGYIAAMFVRKVVDVAVEASPSSRASLVSTCRNIGVDPDMAPDPKQMISDDDFFSLLETLAADIEHGHYIALRTGATMQCNDYGAFGFAFKTAVDMQGSFRRVERYGRLVTNVANYTVVPGDGSTLMAITHVEGAPLGLQLTNELAISAGVALCREVSQEGFSPRAVYFSHPQHADPTVYSDHFQCPVYFDADKDGFEIDDATLQRINQLGDNSVSEFFDTHLDKEMAEFVDGSRIEDRVSIEITQALSEGMPTIEQVAQRMGMSSRTLQRRLSDAGLVYQEVADATRKQLAARLLEREGVSLAEVAFLTGYAEQSTFSRAFKRWFGETPANYRRTRH